VEAVVAMSVLDAISQKDFLMIFISMKNIYCRKSVRDHDGGVAIFLSQGSYEVLPAANYQLENITTFFLQQLLLRRKRKRAFQKHSQNNFVCKNNVFESFQNFFLIQKQQKTTFQKKMQKKKEVGLLQKKFSKRSFNFWRFVTVYKGSFSQAF